MTLGRPLTEAEAMQIAETITDKLWMGEDDPQINELRAAMVRHYLQQHDAVARLAHVTDPEWQERLRMMKLPRLGAPDGR